MLVGVVLCALVFAWFSVRWQLGNMLASLTPANQPNADEISQLAQGLAPSDPVPMWLAATIFLALLGATTLFLWNAHRMGLAQQGLCAAGIVAGLWLVGFVSERPLRAAGRQPSPQS